MATSELHFQPPEPPLKEDLPSEDRNEFGLLNLGVWMLGMLGMLEVSYRIL